MYLSGIKTTTHELQTITILMTLQLLIGWQWKCTIIFTTYWMYHNLISDLKKQTIPLIQIKFNIYLFRIPHSFCLYTGNCWELSQLEYFGNSSCWPLGGVVRKSFRTLHSQHLRKQELPPFHYHPVAVFRFVKIIL